VPRVATNAQVVGKWAFEDLRQVVKVFEAQNPSSGLKMTICRLALAKSAGNVLLTQDAIFSGNARSATQPF